MWSDVSAGEVGVREVLRCLPLFTQLADGQLDLLAAARPRPLGPGRHPVPRRRAVHHLLLRGDRVSGPPLWVDALRRIAARAGLAPGAVNTERVLPT